MARTAAVLSPGSRVSDYVSLGVIAKTFPREQIDAVLAATGRASQRERDMPAHVVVYYVIALALYMQCSYREVLRCLLEGAQWLQGAPVKIKITGKSGISQARTRLGWETLRRLHDAVVVPVAQPTTRGAWYRDWRLVSLDGSCLEVADEQANAAAFGRHKASRGASAYPQLRFVALVENGTHVLFGTQVGPYSTSETALAKKALSALRPGMLCLADRYFFGFPLWRLAQQTGADLLWRIKAGAQLPREAPLEDGSYLSTIHSAPPSRRGRHDSLRVRVIDYRLDGVPDAEPIYRLATTVLDPARAPAENLAALYHERWEIENALDELKTHLRGARIVLRSKTPDLVHQEFYGLMMAHFAVRSLMHEAAAKVGQDPDRLSYLHAVRVVRRKLTGTPAIPPSA